MVTGYKIQAMIKEDVVIKNNIRTLGIKGSIVNKKIIEQIHQMKWLRELSVNNEQSLSNKNIELIMEKIPSSVKVLRIENMQISWKLIQLIGKSKIQEIQISECFYQPDL